MISDGPFLDDLILGMTAKNLDDVEAMRIAAENRLRILTTPRDQPDKDGKFRGAGYTIEHPHVKQVAIVVKNAVKFEMHVQKQLEDMFKEHPLYPWQQSRRGIGMKQFARLLAAIGDPYWNELYDRPRMVSELWAYCGMHVWTVQVDNSMMVVEGEVETGHGSNDNHLGPAQSDNGQCTSGNQIASAQSSSDSQRVSGHPSDDNHDVGATVYSGTDSQAYSDQSGPENHAASVYGIAPHRKRGVKSNWSDEARMRIHLISESILKANGEPYREIYDHTKAKYAGEKHKGPCVRCGPSGHPARPGSPLSKGHIHARGLRAISKAVLKDLWIESQRLHMLHGQMVGDNQAIHATTYPIPNEAALK